MNEETKERVTRLVRQMGKRVLLKSKQRMGEFFQSALKKPFHVLFFPQKAIVVSELERSITRVIGQEFYTDIAKIVAEERFEDVRRNRTIDGAVDTGMVRRLDDIIEALDRGRKKPNCRAEMEEILRSRVGSTTTQTVTADLFIGDFEGGPLCLEFKTPWPKKEDCVRSKKRIVLFKLIQADLTPQAYIAFPYNPFESWDKWHWTAPMVFDREEVKIAEEGWDMLGGSGTYETLLRLSAEVGKEIREEVGLFKGLVEE